MNAASTERQNLSASSDEVTFPGSNTLVLSLIQTCIIWCVKCNRLGWFLTRCEKQIQIEKIRTTVFYATLLNEAYDQH